MNNLTFLQKKRLFLTKCHTKHLTEHSCTDCSALHIIPLELVKHGNYIMKLYFSMILLSKCPLRLVDNV
eukprot:UN27831